MKSISLNTLLVGAIIFLTSSSVFAATDLKGSFDNGFPGLCMDVTNGVDAAGTRLQTWGCSGGPNQNFQYLHNSGQIVVNNDMCVSDSGGYGENGDAIILWPCVGVAAQKWTFSNGQIVGTSGKCIAAGASPTNGSQLYLYDCYSWARDQKWNINGVQSFFIGYDQGWFKNNYGSDYTSSFDSSNVNGVLGALQSAKASVVRLWLFEGLQGIEIQPGSTNAIGLNPTFATNLQWTLNNARSHGLKVYVTLFDGNYSSGSVYWNIFSNSYGYGDQFNNNTLKPLLSILNQNSDVIYGMDLMNEVEAAISKYSMPNGFTGARWWIARTRTFIRGLSPWLRVTASAESGSAGSDIAAGNFSGLGLDFYDMHSYSDQGYLPGNWQGGCGRASSDGVPVILGEFGQASQAINDTLQSSVATNMLNYAFSTGCFSGALAWRFASPDPSPYSFVVDGTWRPAASTLLNMINWWGNWLPW